MNVVFVPSNPKYKSMTSKQYKCAKCGWIYDPAIGDPKNGIPPGTPFEKLPEGWRCPVCGQPKSMFFPVE